MFRQLEFWSDDILSGFTLNGTNFKIYGFAQQQLEHRFIKAFSTLFTL